MASAASIPWRSAIVWRSVLPDAFSGVLVIERAGLDLAPGQVHLEQLVHLLQFQFVVGDEGDLALLALDRAFAALEIEPSGDLAVDAGDGVVDLGKVDPGNDIEARHGKVLFCKSIDLMAIAI